jgi:FtsP/CotA-like multicopper oxidase with cupredoxin domain
LLLLASSVAAQARPLERVRPNDNRARSGIFSSGTLAVRLEARMAVWHPQGDDRPGAAIPVFAEIGRPAQVPGPLIRVPGGTDVIVTVRNLIPSAALTIHGLHSRPAIGAQFNDSIQLAPGAVRTLRFRLDRPGTYYYWGTTTGSSFGARTREDAQLSGVIVVDEPGVRTPLDCIMVIGMWSDTAGSATTRNRNRLLLVINGRSWPHTDRLVYDKGETVRWRVVNASADLHPMHLHGFYFRVNRRGDGRIDTALARPELVNTERMRPGTTMSVSWTPNRLGNWLFHCHTPEHIEPRGPLGYKLATTIAQAGNPAAHSHTGPGAGMGGLVTAIEVKLPDDDTTARLPQPALPSPTRRIRMLVRPNAGSTPRTPFYGVAFDERGLDPEVARGQQAGPPLVLTRGEHTSIWVVNRTSEPTAVHWHGIELESYYDGVPGVSGMRPAPVTGTKAGSPSPAATAQAPRQQLSPAIAPADSFEVRMTPPRSGTFIYHSHLNETRQQRAGVAGALIVVDRGKWDPTRDFPVLFTAPSDSAAEETSLLINGSATPLALELRRGVASRLRLINITATRPGIVVELRQDSTLLAWRTVAKDGAELAQAARTVRPARQPISIGETMDMEFFPTAPGDYRLEVRTSGGALLATLPIRVN